MILCLPNREKTLILSRLTQRRFWQMVVRYQGQTVKSDLVNRVDCLKNPRHPLETLKQQQALLCTVLQHQILFNNFKEHLLA